MATSAAKAQLPPCSCSRKPTAGLAFPWLPQDNPSPRESCSFCSVSLVHPKSDGQQVSEPPFSLPGVYGPALSFSRKSCGKGGHFLAIRSSGGAEKDAVSGSAQ